MSGFLFVDTETGGLDERKAVICQVAAIRTDYNLNIRASFRAYIRPHPDLELHEKAVAVHGLSREALAGEPDEALVAMAFHSFLAMAPEGEKFAGYNCQFDRKFIRAWFKRCDIASPRLLLDIQPCLDVMLEAEKRFRLQKWPKLAQACELAGLELTEAHDAAADIMATLQVARVLREKVAA